MLRSLGIYCIVGICTAVSPQFCQAQTITKVFTPTPYSSFAKHEVIYGCGTLAPGFTGSFRLMVDDPALGFVLDPGLFLGIYVPYDMGAQMGFPNQYIVWSGSLTPDGAGFQPSPIVWQNLFGFPFPTMTPDHLVDLFPTGAVPGDISAPHWVAPY